MKPPKVLVTVPVYSAVQPRPFHSFVSFSQETGRAEARGEYVVRWLVAGPRMSTVNIRNMASINAMEHETDFLLMIDDDMVLPHNFLSRLLAHDVDIVSPLFFKVDPIEPVVYDLDPVGRRMTMLDYPEDALFEAPGGTGTGVMLVKTKVLAAMPAPIWIGPVDPSQGEDVYFCERAKKMGYRTWCDSGIEVGQMSQPFAIGEREYRLTIDSDGVR